MIRTMIMNRTTRETRSGNLLTGCCGEDQTVPIPSAPSITYGSTHGATWAMANGASCPILAATPGASASTGRRDHQQETSEIHPKTEDPSQSAADGAVSLLGGLVSPCLTKNGLLRRAEDAHLLEKGDMELLFDGREIEEESLYAAYGRQLLLFTPSHSECRERRWIPAASPLPMSGSLPPVKTVKRKAGGGAAVGGLSLELQRRMETI